MDSKKKTLHLGRTTKLLLLTAAITAGIVSLLFINIGRASRSGSSQPQVTSTVVKEKELGIQELSTVKYMYTNVGKFSQSNALYGYTVPFTTKSFLITYDGTIKAGLDLSAVQVQVSDNAVTLTLPQAKVLSHEIDENSIEVYDETNNIFNPIHVKDYTTFAAGEKHKMEQKAAQQGLLKEADAKAKTSLTQLLQATAGNRKIAFRQQSTSSASSAASSKK
ncbi:MAG: DUF4230 domain-containing protein [Oscillospiraceae bacterium]|nr:DUF4230 domain-containing protein [Oscillospiraceae bacterium]